MQYRKWFFQLSSDNLVIIASAAAKFLIHMFTLGGGYGFFVDEFYTISLSKHLAFGYVDLPPLAPLVCALSRALFGDSLAAMHILPALAGATTLIFVCLIAKEFGGKTFAVGLSALAFIINPAWLILNSYFSYDAFDQLILSVFVYVLVRLICSGNRRRFSDAAERSGNRRRSSDAAERSGNRRRSSDAAERSGNGKRFSDAAERSGNRKLWILLGGIGGIACLTKMTLLYLGPGFLVALLLSKYRKDLLTPWPWLGAVLCLVIVSPYLGWQVASGWPTLKYWINYGALRLAPLSAPQYALSLIVDMNPFLLPLYVFGLVRLFRRLDDNDYGLFGIWFLASLVLLFGLHAKTWMLLSLYIPLIAAGAVGLEELLVGRSRAKITQAALAVTMLAGGIYVAPVSLPILPVDSLPAFFEKYGPLYGPVQAFNVTSSKIPINLSLRIGWEELVQKVAAVYNDLPPEDQKVAGIYTFWYGPASAIDYYAARYGLPHAVSGHLAYYLWGPGYSWEVMIIVMNRSNAFSTLFFSCAMKDRFLNANSIDINQLNIYVCKKPMVTPEQIWKQVELYR